jgi:hypothetical protein
MSERTRLVHVILATAVAVGGTPSLRVRASTGAIFLWIWPDARSTGLAGAMVGLADEPDAAYWNPGGLGLQKGLGIVGSGGPWLPGLWKGMFRSYASAGYTVRPIRGWPVAVSAGADLNLLSTGETDVINEHGESLGTYRTWDAAYGAHLAVGLWDVLGVGISLKYVYQSLVPEWVWEVMPEIGIETGGVGRTTSADIGLLYRPDKRAFVGVAVANLGPPVRYTRGGEQDSLPRMLRAGFCVTPIDHPLIRPRLLAQAEKVLVGRLRDVWLSAGAEVSVMQLLTLRAGYFDDRFGARTGWCFGVGLGYKDYVRLDFGDDHLIYDFPTANWKVSLTVNNLFGMFEEFGKGRFFDWLR